jgi:hypothetical protein
VQSDVQGVLMLRKEDLPVEDVKRQALLVHAFSFEVVGEGTQGLSTRLS